MSIFGNITEVSTPDFRRVFDTVFWGVVYGSRAAVAHFKTRAPDHHGALINVGSFFGDRARTTNTGLSTMTGPRGRKKKARSTSLDTV